MPKSTLLLKKRALSAPTVVPAASGRVFRISMKGIPRVDAQAKARLEAASRNPGSARQDYPEVIAD